MAGQPRIDPLPLQQLAVRAGLRQGTALQRQDQVGIADRRQAMRIQPNRPMDAALSTLVEFLAEEGRGTGAWQNLAGEAR